MQGCSIKHALALAAVSRPGVGCGAGISSRLSEPELQQFRFLRRLLGLPRSTPTATLLVEAGQVPLHARWLRQAARLWNSLARAPAGSLQQQIVEAAAALASDCSDVSTAQRPWAAQLVDSMRAVGIPFNPQAMQQLSPMSVQQAALQRHRRPHSA
jgi:hypothetical protein